MQKKYYYFAGILALVLVLLYLGKCKCDRQRETTSRAEYKPQFNKTVPQTVTTDAENVSNNS